MSFDMFYQHIMMSPIQNINVKKNKTFLCETRMPPAATNSKYGKNISKSYILTLPHPRGMWCQWGVRNP